MAVKGANRSESIIRRTRKLIYGYPKNTIIKEFLQNADDAKATELVVIYDARIHTNLENTIFSPAKGPALLICNNSKFNEKDFDAIVEIGFEDSKQDDPNSTGRFGEGFNSSFSITDHPSFISNGRVYWFDILREAVSKDRNTPDTRYWEKEDYNEIKEWLNVFSLGSQNYFDNHDTVFRLPLRNSSTNSKISNEIFSKEDFLKWVDELKSNASQLLFLRHIRKLILQEIGTDGKVTNHLKIYTKNDSEILRINNAIQKEFDGKPLDICKKWKENDSNLPYFKYKHHYIIEYFEREKKYKEKYQEGWAVVNGLFRGENNSIIDQAVKALEISPEPRKVMPWAGVAVQLDNEGKLQKITNSKFFTFLPLPIKSKYPVHINGWFDLDSERTVITNEKSDKDLEILTEWNQLLLKEGVAKAWSILIDYLKKESKANYTFWAKDTEFALNDYLVKGFYENISNLKCLYATYQNKQEWLSPKENTLYYVKTETTNKILLNALQEHFKIILSKPQNFIIENFKKVGIELIEITPEYLRDYLKNESKDIDFPISMQDIPIKMLQEKEWFIEVLKYCVNNEEDNSLLEKLPLELTLDNNIYQVGSDTLFDINPDLELFQDMKYLFIDTDVVNAIKDLETLPNSWLEPTLNNKLSLLLE